LDAWPPRNDSENAGADFSAIRHIAERFAVEIEAVDVQDNRIWQVMSRSDCGKHLPGKALCQGTTSVVPNKWLKSDGF
jgi:hypothetical protein